jgi:tetratricopeptide (TPR) repeat protein
MEAIKRFTDRVEPMKKVKSETNKIIKNNNYKRLINFYGIGGIGKTRFLNEFEILLRDFEMVEHAMVSLDSYEINYPLKVLINLRRQLKGIDFVLFDYALIQYYTKIHKPTEAIVNELKSFDSQFISVFKEIGDNALETFVPYFSSIKKLYQSSRKLLQISKNKKHEEIFREYENMSTMDLFNKLPSFFSNALNDANRPLVFLLDDYESYLNKTKGKSVSTNAESWFYEIYRRTNRIVFIIASRDMIKNYTDYYIQIDEVEQFRLTKLSDKDIEEFLANIPITRKDIVDTIKKSSNGVPLYLDLFVNHYFEQEGRFEDISDFEAPKLKQLIERYLSHLKPSEKEVVHHIASFDKVCCDFIMYICRKRNIHISDEELKLLLDKTLFIGEDLYQKLDYTLKDHILESRKHDDHILSSIELLMDFVLNEITVTTNSFEVYLSQLINKFSDFNLITTKHIEDWVRIINLIGDRTYFSPFDNIFIETFKDKSEKHQAIFIYYTLLKTRRTGLVKDGKELMDSLKSKGYDFDIYGEMKGALELLDVFFIHLTGHYPEAFKAYQELIDDHEMMGTLHNDPRTLNNALYKYGDLLFLYGRFNKSHQTLMKINISNITSHATRNEIIRTRAHVYRLNYHYEKADRIYKKILSDKDTKDYRIMANTTTSVAENLQFFKPIEAIEYAQKAIELNSKINSKIEIGKAFAAKSIAHSMLKEYDEAEKSYKKAIEIQTQTGYQSGVLFGLIAKFVLTVYSPKYKNYDITACLSEIKEMWKELTVYKSFGIIIHILLNEEIEELQDIDWLDYNQTYNNLYKVLKRN